MTVTFNIWTDFLMLIVFGFICLYFYTLHLYGYWKKKGVYSPKTQFPVGHLGGVILGKEHIGVRMANYYHQTKKHPFAGLYLLHSKTILINDLDLIKAIMVKDFQHFPDHGLGISHSGDPLSHNLFNMEGSAWKELRNKLSPTFTSSKMKYMFETMLNCSAAMENFLDHEVSCGNMVDLREVLAKYGTDVIGSCAFGIETNSFKYPDAEFRKMGKQIFATNFEKGMKDMLSVYAPSFVKKYNIRMVPKNLEDFFINTVMETMKYREENNIARNDFLQLLIDMKKTDELNGNSNSLSVAEMTAQVFLFFAAGFETSSTTASYALYELAKNQDVQDRLREEIDSVMEKYNGKITYESTMEMDYLNQVIEESLRMYPPLPFLFRQCVKDYTIPNHDVVIEKGTRVIIPILGIQRDPDIHEDPDQFRPERFSADNKNSMHQFSSISFGEGPRICIGSRFGMMQARLGLITILSKYKVYPDQKSTSKIEFDPRGFILGTKKSQLFKITRRNNAK